MQNNNCIDSQQITKTNIDVQGHAEQTRTKAELLADARAIVAMAESGDNGAPFEPDNLAALNELRDRFYADWQRIRAQLKKSKVQIRALDQAMRGEDGDELQGITEILIKIGTEECEFFHDADKEPYASFERDGHRENWPVWSKGFAEWISWRCYTIEGRAPRKAALDDALGTLSGKAKFDGDEKEIALRVAQHDGAYYLDLCDDQWRTIEIRPSGWRIVDRSPIPFVRTSTMRALPAPVAGGDINELWSLINIPDEVRLLVLAWLLECMRPETPYAVLELVGEQGSAKSSTQSMLRDLIDPSEVNLRAAPKSSEDIYIAAKNNHLVSFENLSHLGADYQDALCILATGGGFASRTLYTNAEETLVKVKRPVVLNGISVVVVAQDLLSRAVHVSMRNITAYRDELELKAAIADARPRILDALLDLFVATLAILPTIEIPADQRPRMIDFATLGEAMACALGHAPGVFSQAYKANREDATYRTIDAMPVAAAAMAWIKDNPAGFSGLIGELFERLSHSHYKPKDDSTGWPKSAKGFADAMRRAAPALRTLKVEFTATAQRTKQGYKCALRNIADVSRSESVTQQNQVHEVHHAHQSGRNTVAGDLGVHRALEIATPHKRCANTTALDMPTPHTPAVAVSSQFAAPSIFDSHSEVTL